MQGCVVEVDETNQRLEILARVSWSLPYLEDACLCFSGVGDARNKCR